MSTGMAVCIGGLVLGLLTVLFLMYCCCVVSGRCSDEEERRHDQE